MSNPYTSALDPQPEPEPKKPQAKKQDNTSNPYQSAVDPKASDPSVNNLNTPVIKTTQYQTADPEAAKRESEKKAELASKVVEAGNKFLRQISSKDPLDEDRRWFEDYAQHFDSRLDAAIDFLGLKLPQ